MCRPRWRGGCSVGESHEFLVITKSGFYTMSPTTPQSLKHIINCPYIIPRPDYLLCPLWWRDWYSDLSDSSDSDSESESLSDVLVTLLDPLDPLDPLDCFDDRRYRLSRVCANSAINAVISSGTKWPPGCKYPGLEPSGAKLRSLFPCTKCSIM